MQLTLSEREAAAILSFLKSASHVLESTLEDMRASNSEMEMDFVRNFRNACKSLDSQMVAQYVSYTALTDDEGKFVEP